MKYAVIIGVLLVSLPLLARVHTEDPYPDARSYEGLRTAQLNDYDALYATPYHPTLSDTIFAHLPPQLVLIILIAVTLLCMSFILPRESFVLLLVTSPALLATFTTVDESALGFTIIAIAALLLKHRHPWGLIAIPVCFSLSFPLGILAGITLVVLALIWQQRFVALGASFLCLISGILGVTLYTDRGLGLAVPSLSQLVGFVGSTDGITVFLVFLGVIGFLLTWRETKKNGHLFALLIVPSVLFFEQGTVIAAVILAYYASQAWETLVSRPWHFEELQSITLVLIACGVLFTTIVVEKERYVVDKERVDAVRFITSAYPKGTPIYAGQDISPILAYNGYPAYTIPLPKNPGFIASTLREAHIPLVVTRTNDPPVSHFPIVYQEHETGYRVYAVPAE